MITITAGAGRSLERPARSYPNTQSVLNDTGLQAALGFSSSSSEAHVNGTGGVTTINDNDIVSIVPRANTKG